MKQFTITYVVHPHFNIPCKYQIQAVNEIESIASAEKALKVRHPEGVSIVTSQQQLVA
ncbi:addiction module component [Photobacterium sp. BZF1]|uniref:addiction module component n=1 Tax=Photobacterium sp. BZF1 TaxID=1904457 RepID=UPI001653C59D|nr:addiction module component [Photobacterium sp. BZF1]MBC7004929.1 addiction module component [Photobacterium sp. BZF1]